MRDSFFSTFSTFAPFSIFLSSSIVNRLIALFFLAMITMTTYASQDSQDTIQEKDTKSTQGIILFYHPTWPEAKISDLKRLANVLNGVAIPLTANSYQISPTRKNK